MFFIGIAGVGAKIFPAGKSVKSQCNICSSGQVEHFVRKKYFHLFFIPLFYWGNEEFDRCADCGAVQDDNRYLSGPGAAGFSCITCVSCGKKASFNIPQDEKPKFCPYCGSLF